MILHRVTAVLAAGLLASACSPAPASGSGEPPAQTPKVAPEPEAGPFLTPGGLGPIRIGMTEAEVRAAVGPNRLDGDTGDDFEGCKEMQLKGNLAGVWVMLQEDEVTRITLGEGSTHKTDKGLGVGSSAAQVRAAYGAALQVEPHKYAGEGAEYLTVWTKPETEGLRYETAQNGIVDTIHAGGGSIRYVEGCA